MGFNLCGHNFVKLILLQGCFQRAGSIFFKCFHDIGEDSRRIEVRSTRQDFAADDSDA